MSEVGCTHPHGCIKMAQKLINAIALRWRPTVPDNGQTPVQPGRENAPEIALEETELVVSNQTETTDLEASIRIFTDAKDTVEDIEQNESMGEQNPGNETIVYTNGSCLNNGTAEARVGSGIWFGNDDPRNMAIRVPGEKQSNQIGELLAILYAVRTAPRNILLRIQSDSKFAIEGLTKHALVWEAKDWMGVKHGKLFRCTTAWIRARPNVTTLQWVKGHAGILGNEEADKLAVEGTQKEMREREVDLGIPGDTMITGARLTAASQSMIYHHLKERGEIERQTTSRSLRTVEETTKEVFGLTPTVEAIWRGMRHRDISKKGRDFLWKHAHGIYQLGSYWDNIAGYENRGICPLCQQPETFWHIIQECESEAHRVIWEVANDLWKIRYQDDLPMTVGAVLGCGLANFTKGNGRPDTAKNRLYRILMSELAHLIWVLRCERRIRNEDECDHPEREVRNRWYKRINDRMQMDCLLTNEYLFEKKALKTKLVHGTWVKCSTNETDLH